MGQAVLLGSRAAAGVAAGADSQELVAVVGWVVGLERVAK